MLRTKLLLMLFLIPLSVSAAGLGQLKMKSALGEPLNAEIEVIEDPSEAQTVLTANLASRAEYEAAGLPDAFLAAGLHVEVASRADNTRILKLTSDHAVNEPFVELLINAEASGARISRQFTVLLDPPESQFPTLTSASSAAASPQTGYRQNVEKSRTPAAYAETTAEEIIPEYVPRKSRISTKARAKTAPAASVIAEAPARASNPNGGPEEIYTTQNGDVFGKIAQRYQPAGVRLKHVMAAFQAANPDAFINGDMNQLKIGQVLHIPTHEALGGAPKEAQEPVKPAPDKQEAAAIKDKNAVPKTEASPKFVLQISPSDSESDGANTADQSPAAPSSNPPTVNSPVATAEPNQAPPAMETSPSNPQVAPAEVLPAAHPAITVQSGAKSATLTQSVVDNTSFMDKLIAHLPWIAFGMVIPLLIIMAIYILNKRRSAVMQELQQTIFQGNHTIIPTKSLHETAFELSPDPGNSELYGGAYAHNTAMFPEDTQIDINEVDPLVEAEIYMSYGRDEQAEHILLNALDKSPYKLELMLGLLKIYAERKDISSFEPLAREIYKSAENGNIQDAIIWGKAAILGLRIDPDNSLYQIEGASPEPQSVDSSEAEPVIEALPDEAHSIEFAALPPLEGFETLTQDQAEWDKEPKILPEPVQAKIEEMPPLQPAAQTTPDKSNVFKLTLEDISPASKDIKSKDLGHSVKIFPGLKKRNDA